MLIPVEVRSDEAKVRIRWSDGHASIYANKKLRDACLCAACKGEQGLLGRVYLLPMAGSVPEDVRATAHTLVGRYAIGFVWSDGHSTGIYPYDYLLAICECGRCSASKSA